MAESQLVGGEIKPIQATSLILAGIQSGAVWIIPVVLVGVDLVTFRLQKF
jgi:hypothetical protein